MALWEIKSAIMVLAIESHSRVLYFFKGLMNLRGQMW